MMPSTNSLSYRVVAGLVLRSFLVFSPITIHRSAFLHSQPPSEFIGDPIFLLSTSKEQAVERVPWGGGTLHH